MYVGVCTHATLQYEKRINEGQHDNVCMHVCLKQQEVQDLWFMVRTSHQADEECVCVACERDRVL